MERLKDIIERNYDKPIKPTEYLDYLESEQKEKEEQTDGELDVLFIDKEDQWGLKKQAMIN